jgi:hypothetical protein
MTNVQMKRTGNTLTITVDLAQDHGRSTSGKTTIVASTQGSVKVEGPGISIGLNVYKK